MKLIITSAVAFAFMASMASAGEWGQRGDANVKSISNSYSNSSSRASSNNNNNISYRDRVQAPGFGVGASYCSNGLSIAFPGGGFGFSAMERACKTEINARVASTYLSKQAAAQFVCQQPEFKNLTVCRGGKR